MSFCTRGSKPYDTAAHPQFGPVENNGRAKFRARTCATVSQVAHERNGLLRNTRIVVERKSGVFKQTRAFWRDRARATGAVRRRAPRATRRLTGKNGGSDRSGAGSASALETRLRAQWKRVHFGGEAFRAGWRWRSGDVGACAASAAGAKAIGRGHCGRFDSRWNAGVGAVCCVVQRCLFGDVLADTEFRRRVTAGIGGLWACVAGK